MDRVINYNFYHWGPFLYKTSVNEKEIKEIKKLCNRKSKDYRVHLAGIIKEEKEIDVKKLFPIIFPYIDSYAKAMIDYGLQPLGDKIELTAAWVNYMTKFESNPLHIHDDDLSFVIYTDIPKKLEKEFKTNVGTSKPGAIHFIHTLGKLKYHINQHIFMPQVGDFFIFPASLHHCVNYFQSEGERVSISGNLKIK
tara:strand:- start:14 stop:598 length:585 start_codon:yes stop_codon:yes gene_type:complete